MAFEVASIKPTPDYPPHTADDIRSGRRRPIGLQVEGDRVDIREVSLRYSLGQAYRVRPIYIIGEAWLDTAKFDISAKIPAGASAQEVPEMLQSLLAERFVVRTHREIRQLSAYVLTVAKDRFKLKELPPDTPIGVRNAPGLTISIGPLADAIGAAGSFAGLRQPLINQTGLLGKYEVPIDPALVFGGVRDALDDADALDRMRQAVEPLGLKIDRMTLPTEVAVIDHIEHTPSGN